MKVTVLGSVITKNKPTKSERNIKIKKVEKSR